MPALFRTDRSSSHSLRKILRRRIFQSLILGLGMSLAAEVAVAAGAAKKTYECNLVSQGAGGVVPETVIVFSDDDFKTAYVYDNYIHHAGRQPIRVIPKAMSAGKYRMSWNLDGIKFNNKTFETASTIYLDTKRMRIGFDGVLKSYDNEIHGAGKCVLVPPKTKKK